MSRLLHEHQSLYFNVQELLMEEAGLDVPALRRLSK